jgi:hypothetical protein
MNNIEVANLKTKDLYRIYKSFFDGKDPMDLMNDLGVIGEKLGLESIYFKVVDEEKFKSACVKYDLTPEMVMLNQHTDYVNSPYKITYTFEA